MDTAAPLESLIVRRWAGLEQRRVARNGAVPLDEVRPVLGWHVEEVGDDRAGERAGERCQKLDCSRRRERIDQGAGDFADPGLEFGDPPGREPTAD